MLFNTEQTTRMLAMVNREFANDDTGGNFEEWRRRKAESHPTNASGKKLHDLAFDHNVVPSNDDTNRKARSRWRKWLKQLQTETIVPNDPANPNGTAWAIPAAGAAAVPLDQELRRQMFNALSDGNCIELAFNAVPQAAGAASKITIGSKQAVWTDAGPKFAYLITLYTLRVDQL